MPFNCHFRHQRIRFFFALHPIKHFARHRAFVEHEGTDHINAFYRNLLVILVIKSLIFTV